MYQQFLIIGRVGREPDMKYTANGIPVCNFSVAVDTGYGENKTTTWVRVTCWRKLAETAAQYVTKGMKIMVEGEASVHAYLNNNNEPAATLELTANTMKFLGGGEPREQQHNEAPDEIGQIPF